MKRKHVLTLLFIISIILFLYTQNNMIQVTKYEIINSKIPESFNGYKIIQISDYHNAKSKILNNQLLKRIEVEEPDIIIITGDLIDATNTDINQSINFIKAIKNIAPIYYVTGNHETWIDNYDELKLQLITNDVNILENVG